MNSTLRVSVGLGWGPQICISNKFPIYAGPAGTRTHSESHWSLIFKHSCMIPCTYLGIHAQLQLQDLTLTIPDNEVIHDFLQF